MLAYQSLLEEYNYSAAILASGEPLGHPFWRKWLTNPVHPENVREYFWVEGPHLIRYGQSSLQGLLYLEEERPSQKEDVYLIRALGGYQYLGDAFIRAGGYATEGMSVYASAWRESFHGSEGRGDLADDQYHWQAFQTSWSYEGEKEWEVYGFLKGREGTLGLENSFSFLGGKYRVLQILPKIGAQWKASSILQWEGGASFEYSQERLISPTYLYQNIYRTNPSNRWKRLFSWIKGRIKKKNSWFWGDETEFGAHLESLWIRNFALASPDFKGLTFFTHFYQKRKLFSFLEAEEFLGVGKGLFGSPRFSYGLAVSAHFGFQGTKKNHEVKVSGYRHYSSIPLFFYQGKLYDTAGNLFWKGKKTLHPPKIHKFSLQYQWTHEKFRGKAALYYQEIFPISPLLSGALLVPLNEPKLEFGGFEVEGSLRFSDQWKGGGRISQVLPLKKLPQNHKPPPLTAYFYIDYTANSESYFRGWKGRMELFFRDSFQSISWNSGETKRNRSIIDLNIFLSYRYHGFGNRLELFMGIQNLIHGDRKEFRSSPFQGEKQDIATERIYWFGLRLSL